MSAQAPLPPVSAAPSPGRGVRIEYLDSREVDEHREYRFRVYGLDGSNEYRLRIANAAFDARRVRMQDGPDLCYQKLLRAIAAGLTAQPDVITIADTDFFSYRDDHTPVPKRRTWTPSTPATAAVAPRRPPQSRPRPTRTPSPRPAVAALAAEIEPAFAAGQRVNHAVFGLGVTAATTSARTVVAFDEGGPKSFVTSMLEVEVLSAAHTWETSPRGMNRPCATLGRAGDPSV